MGYSQYFEVWPHSLADKVVQDADAWGAFRALWGHGSGMHDWFDELDDEELAEILADVRREGADRLRAALASAPAHPSAFLYKSMAAHLSIMRTAFGSGREQLADIALHGGRAVRPGDALRVIEHGECRTIYETLKASDLDALVRSNCAPSGCHPDEEALHSELGELMEVYRLATEDGHQVITGSP